MKRKASPEFQEKVQRLKLTLEPIYPLPVGSPHPAFPRTMLQFHLLTEEQLDGMAKHYHQTEHCEYTFEYPERMVWDTAYFDTLDTIDRVAVKRRKLGNFIGLRGCDTPAEELLKRLELLSKRVEEEARREAQQEDRERKLGYHRRW